MLSAALFVFSQTIAAQVPVVTVVLVPHPEISYEPPTYPLSSAGRQRAQLLVHTFKDLKFTHILASHTTRARETVEGVASSNRLKVVQLPAPGSMIDGQPVTNDTSRQAAIKPVADAVLALPQGSVVLIGANSDNLYGILHSLGVPVPAKGDTCPVGSICVPCTTKDCFPGGEFDRLWYLVIEAGRAKPLVMLESRYGAGWKPTHP